MDGRFPQPPAFGRAGGRSAEDEHPASRLPPSLRQRLSLPFERQQPADWQRERERERERAGHDAAWGSRPGPRPPSPGGRPAAPGDRLRSESRGDPGDRRDDERKRPRSPASSRGGGRAEGDEHPANRLPPSLRQRLSLPDERHSERRPADWERERERGRERAGYETGRSGRPDARPRSPVGQPAAGGADRLHSESRGDRRGSGDGDRRGGHDRSDGSRGRDRDRPAPTTAARTDRREVAAPRLQQQGQQGHQPQPQPQPQPQQQQPQPQPQPQPQQQEWHHQHQHQQHQHQQQYQDHHQQPHWHWHQYPHQQPQPQPQHQQGQHQQQHWHRHQHQQPQPQQDQQLLQQPQQQPQPQRQQQQQQQQQQVQQQQQQQQQQQHSKEAPLQSTYAALASPNGGAPPRARIEFALQAIEGRDLTPRRSKHASAGSAEAAQAAGSTSGGAAPLAPGDKREHNRDAERAADTARTHEAKPTTPCAAAAGGDGVAGPLQPAAHPGSPPRASGVLAAASLGKLEPKDKEASSRDAAAGGEQEREHERQRQRDRDKERTAVAAAAARADEPARPAAPHAAAEGSRGAAEPPRPAARTGSPQRGGRSGKGVLGATSLGIPELDAKLEAAAARRARRGGALLRSVPLSRQLSSDEVWAAACKLTKATSELLDGEAAAARRRSRAQRELPARLGGRLLAQVDPAARLPAAGEAHTRQMQAAADAFRRHMAAPWVAALPGGGSFSMPAELRGVLW
ncbi:hypothetical protein HT031_000564 [Scenedesmus sp. PABB004]|nr:hypothetical protein HT031_000564 [Scenedesmus sp. PABB004]